MPSPVLQEASARMLEVTGVSGTEMTPSMWLPATTILCLLWLDILKFFLTSRIFALFCNSYDGQRPPRVFKEEKEGSIAAGGPSLRDKGSLH